ncbi:universal stress protein [Cochleicola gelatinilyticus]|uniref:UspA domain-containing protein n=1 Tax=Cochleicola gelatinilyticus TaxID=1763537 RepID=A0A167J5W9_9FLAO|nr:universal stress protein [Cochleicola gelatinilyticus]OAB80356.1 hypothetical protein ULVI_06370 [Cochleicola gelatinilyticus]
MKHIKKCKVLVLLDLNDRSLNVLKSANRIAEIVDAEIEMFHVRKPTQIVKMDSNLSAVKDIKDHFVTIENELKKMGVEVFGNSNISGNHFHTFGNIKNEIEKHIRKTNPDIVVVGKKASKSPGFIGDKILPFLLKKFQGTVMVTDHDVVLNGMSKLKIGVLDNTPLESKSPYIKTLLENSEAPIHSYEISSGFKEDEDRTAQKKQEIVSYVFEKSDQSLQTISSYMNRSKINLLLVNRNSKIGSNNRDFSISKLNDLVQTMKVPVLLS